LAPWQQASGYIVEYLGLGSGVLREFLDSTVTDKLISNMEEADVDVEADSWHEYDYDGLEVEFVGYDYLIGSDGEVLMDVLRIEDEKVVLQLYLCVLCRAYADFTLSIYDSVDKDYVKLGGSHSVVDAEYDRTVIVELGGPYGCTDLNQMTIRNIDIPEDRILLDFGFVDLDFEEDWYPDPD